MTKKRKVRLKPSSYQPSKAELEKDMSIKGAIPEQVARAVLTRVEVKQGKD